jgi:hypothetical protein
MRLSFHLLNRWSIQIDLGINNQQRVIAIQDIIINRHPIKILFQQAFKKQIFFFQRGFLLFNG